MTEQPETEGMSQEDADRAQAIIDNLRRRLAQCSDALIATETELELLTRKFQIQQQIIEALVNEREAQDVDAKEDSVEEASPEAEGDDDVAAD